MSLQVNCPHCSQSYQVAEEHFGRKIQCQTCKREFLIGKPLEGNTTSDMEAPPIQVSAKANKHRAAKSRRPPNRKTGRPWFLGFIFDFDFRYYFTARIIRIIWILLFLIYVVVTVTNVTTLAVASWAMGDAKFSSLVNENWRLLATAILSQITGTFVLLFWRVILELILVGFNIAETLESIEEKL